MSSGMPPSLTKPPGVRGCSSGSSLSSVVLTRLGLSESRLLTMPCSSRGTPEPGLRSTAALAPSSSHRVPNQSNISISPSDVHPSTKMRKALATQLRTATDFGTGIGASGTATDGGATVGVSSRRPGAEKS